MVGGVEGGLGGGTPTINTRIVEPSKTDDILYDELWWSVTSLPIVSLCIKSLENKCIIM